MIAVALYSAMVLGAGGDGAADRVLGQFDFDPSAANLVDGKGMFGPDAVAIDGSVTPNRIYVADSEQQPRPGLERRRLLQQRRIQPTW